MDPSNPDSFNHQVKLLSTGRTYHWVDQVPAEYDASKTTTILLLHGFPENWFVVVFRSLTLHVSICIIREFQVWRQVHHSASR